MLKAIYLQIFIRLFHIIPQNLKQIFKSMKITLGNYIIVFKKNVILPPNNTFSKNI